jgi:hypothetical protein
MTINNNTASTVAARKGRVTAQDVAMMMLVGGGVEAVRACHDVNGIVSATFDKAIELLAGSPDNAEALADLQDELFQASTGARGRPAVTVGQSRSYRVQEVGETGAFIRLPVALLGLTKGQTATVLFLDGVITVKV